MPKERNKADSYREKAYEGDTKAMNNLGVCYEPTTLAMVSNKIIIRLSFGTGRQPSKVMCRVRRTAVQLIGMAMVWRRIWRNVLSGMSWRPMAAMPRHNLPQAGF